MTNIDFSRIRGANAAGQRDAFEEFVCQLARADICGDEVEFRRVEGSGGDGGVECYWLLRDGTKRAYQAKYWLHTADIDWKKIKESVVQAMSSHPEVVSYTVALACDLTGKSGKKRKGKEGWEHWTRHRKIWLEHASEQQLDIDYKVWTEFELRARALEQLPSGSIKYWFDKNVLDEQWFEAKAKTSLSDLGIRYSPLAHIETKVEESFRVFSRDHDSLRLVTQSLNSFRSLCIDLKQRLDDLGFTESATKFETFAAEMDQLKTDIFPSDVTTRLRWEDVIADSLAAIKNFLNLEQNLRTAALNEDPTRQTNQEINKLVEEVDRLIEVLDSEQFQFWDAEAMLLLGTFGTGKSHAMGKILDAAVMESRPAVLFLGQKFVDRNPQSQMLQFLDLSPNYSWEEFLDSLNAAAEASGKLGLILIDAINEGAGTSIWRNNLAGVLEEVSRRPALRIIVSCRSEYRDRIWPPAANVSKYELSGFSEEEFQRACIRLMDEQGISRPNRAFLPPAFYNPLILSSVCQSLSYQGVSQFPGSLWGLSNFVDLYVRGVSIAIEQQFSLFGPLENLIQRAFLSLADAMIKSATGVVSEIDARRILHDAIGREPPPGTDWLDVFIGSGAVRLDPDPNQSWDVGVDIVRFAFQIHEQEFVARGLMKLAESSENPFDVDEPLAFFRDLGKRRGSVGTKFQIRDWEGVLLALGVLWPRVKTDQEIIDALPQGDEFSGLHQVIRKSVLDGFLWRTPDEISDRTSVLLREIADSATYYSTLFKFSGISEHPWNGHKLHQELIGYDEMAERDADWTVAINESTEFRSSIQGHIHWSLSYASSLTEPVVSELAAIALIWVFTSTNRSLRDQSTKALTRLFQSLPAAMPRILQRFAEANDVYLIERLMAAIYGACCKLKSESVGTIALGVYAQVFNTDNLTVHLLVRDYALRILERAIFLEVLPQEIDLNLCVPPYTSQWPLETYTNADIDRLAASLGDESAEIARSCTTEYGRGVSQYGDFGRYVLEHHVDRFFPVSLDVEESKVESQNSHWCGEKIGNWVANRAYHLGWHIDRFPNDRSYGEHHRLFRSTTERIGKKYQWIAMYELLGILADHVWCKDHRDKPKVFRSVLDLDFCRDIDPTVVSQDSFETMPIENSAKFEFQGLGDVSQPHWPFNYESLLDLEQAVTFVAENGRRWYRLFSSASDDRLGGADAASYMSFISVSTTCIPVSKFRSSLRRLVQEHSNTVFSLHPPELVDHEYLYELDWRETRNRLQKGESNVQLSSGKRVTREDEYIPTVLRYRWEPERDASLADGVSSLLPNSWIIRDMGLTIDEHRPTILKNTEGTVRFFGSDKGKQDNGYSACFIDADAFDLLLNHRKLVLVWILEGERVLSEGFGSSRRRFYHGIARLGVNGIETNTWWNDKDY